MKRAGSELRGPSIALIHTSDLVVTVAVAINATEAEANLWLLRGLLWVGLGRLFALALHDRLRDPKKKAAACGRGRGTQGGLCVNKRRGAGAEKAGVGAVKKKSAPA